MMKAQRRISTVTFVAELNLQGETEKVMASMLNDQVDSFEKTPVECELESLDGKVKKEQYKFHSESCYR